MLGGRLICASRARPSRRPRRHPAGCGVFGAAARAPIELGAGVGAAGLAVAHRVDDLAVTLVELDPALVALARDNAEHNGAERARAVCLDVAAPADAFAAAGLPAGAADHVLMNPPFNAAHNPSPDRSRRLAYVAAHDTLVPLDRSRSAASASGGCCHVDMAGGRSRRRARRSRRQLRRRHRLAGSPEARRAGNPRAGARHQGKPCGARAVAGFDFADANGRPTAEAQAVLRDGALLPLASD